MNKLQNKIIYKFTKLQNKIIHKIVKIIMK